MKQVKSWLRKLLRVLQDDLKGQQWHRVEAVVDGKRMTEHAYVHWSVIHRWTTCWCGMLSLDGDDFKLDVPKSVWDRIRVGDTLPVAYRSSRFDETKREWVLDASRITLKTTLVIRR